MDKQKYQMFLEMFNSEFSQEITDGEALYFLGMCPLGNKVSKELINGYLVSRMIIDSPCQSLRVVLEAFIKTVEEMK
jgi:hypothetical protein